MQKVTWRPGRSLMPPRAHWRKRRRPVAPQLGRCESSYAALRLAALQYGQPSAGASRLTRIDPWSARYVSSGFGARNPVAHTMNSVTAADGTTPLSETTL